MQEKRGEEYMVIIVRPEGCTYGNSSYITLNRRDMRSKFGYTNEVKTFIVELWKRAGNILFNKNY